MLEKMSRSLRLAAAATVVAALAAPAPALATWTAPTLIGRASDANPVAQGAFGGSVLTGWLEPTVSLAKRSGDRFTAPAPITAADPFERVWASGLDADGNAVVVTVRRHKPLQRIRATFVAADGARSATRTISDNTHSAAGPMLSVAPDGTAVAGWSWHDPAGWRARVAVRRPGQPRFDRPQNVSPPAAKVGRTQPRPWLNVAAGEGGRAAVTWQIGGSFELPEAPLHVRTAGTDGVFGADQELADAGGLADVALAVGADGAVQVAYLDQHFAGREGPSSLRVSQGTAGAPLSPPAVLSTGGMGTSSGTQVAAVFSADGSATVAWAKPGNRYEEGGTLEVFTRPAVGAFGMPQTLAQHAEGVVAAGGPGGSAVLAWMLQTQHRRSVSYAVHASTRPQAGGAFGADTTISDTSVNGLWPTVAMTATGDAIAAWVTNTDGSGGGQPTAAIHAAG
jgi:hypothetical protein